MLTTTISAAWRRATVPGDQAPAAAWSDTPPRNRVAAAAWGRAERHDLQPAAGWGAVPARDAARAGAWANANPQASDSAASWGTVPAKDAAARPGWDQSIQPQQPSTRLTYNPRPAWKDVAPGQRYQRSDEHGPRRDKAADVRASLYIPGPGPLAFDFGGTPYTPATAPQVFFDFRYVPPLRAIRPVDAGTAPAWAVARRLDQRARLLWGRAAWIDPIPTGVAWPDYSAPIIVVEPPAEPDILETYMIANSVELVVLPERTPLDATSIQIARDIDAYSWTLTASLFGVTSLNLVRPGADGPKTVELTINGHVWRFLIERYSGQGKFPAERYSITGVSRTQLLAEPYARKTSAVNAVDINARQACIDQLLYTDFSLAWDAVNNNPPDWTLPAGVLSYQQQTPMQIIARIAESVGAVVRPDMASDGLTVVSRYREAVWDWSAAVMDRIVPAEIIMEWGSEWTPQPAWNSCYVSGTTQGVAVDVRRAGTAGDDPAPDVYDDLITSTAAARHRGIAELCKGGNQEVVTLNLPLFPAATAPGLIQPAMLCEVRVPGDTWRGLCLETSISAEGIGAARVKQTIKLERHH